MEEERAKHKRRLTYVNNFPTNKKYIALFPKEDNDKSKEQREQMMEKIMKVVEVKNKIREKELLEAENEDKEE